MKSVLYVKQFGVCCKTLSRAPRDLCKDSLYMFNPEECKPLCSFQDAAKEGEL